MAKYKMKLLSRFFIELKSGKKCIELRCNDAKRRNLIVGDEILFSDISTGETIATAIRELEHADSFSQLVSEYALEDFGFTGSDIDSVLDMLHQIYPTEQEQSLGVVAIHIESIQEEVQVG